MNLRQAKEITGSLGYPSKMPGTSYGLPAQACKTGAVLAKLKGSICESCYALDRGNYIFTDVKKSQAKRLESISNPRWTAAMVAHLEHVHRRGTGKHGVFSIGWHRWHDSGDIQSVEHLTKIAAVAALTPWCWHWLPIKEYGFLRQYIAQGGVIPENLCVRVSAAMIDGTPPRFWPQVSSVHRDKPAPEGAYTCPAPKQDGKCESCRACWNRDITHTSYQFH